MASRSAPYLDKNYTGTPVSILEQLLADTYPVWSIDSASDPYWNTAINNLIGGSGTSYSQVGVWFNKCVAHPKYDHTLTSGRTSGSGFEGWVEANNWLIRTFSAAGQVTFGWQDNMWAVGSGFWLHADLTDAADRQRLFEAGVELAEEERAQHDQERSPRRVLYSRLFRVRPL